MHDLIANIDRLHTTDMGSVRISRNLMLCGDMNVVALCRDMILSHDARIERRGKNYYIDSHDCIITVNATSFNIITVHRKK